MDAKISPAVSLFLFQCLISSVRMAERSKALRSGRSPLLWAWVRIPLLTKLFACRWIKGDNYIGWG